MSKHQFNAEFTTSVYTNGNGAVTICQSDDTGSCSYVVIGSKTRAFELAGAIRQVARRCSFGFEQIREEESE